MVDTELNEKEARGLETRRSKDICSGRHTILGFGNLWDGDPWEAQGLVVTSDIVDQGSSSTSAWQMY